MARRSDAKLEELIIWVDTLQNDAHMTDFVRSVGSYVKVLSLTGRVSDAMIGWIVSSPDECLPNLQSLTVVGEKRVAKLTLECPQSWLNVPFGLLPFLQRVLNGARRRRGVLKSLELGVYPSEHPINDVELDKCVNALREDGVLMALPTLCEMTYPILEHLGKVIGGKGGTLKTYWPENSSLVENMPAINGIFRMVERHLDENQLTKKDVKALLSLWAAMASYAYAAPGPPREGEFYTRSRAKAIVRRLNAI
ncbi:hypothetical protein AAF712_016518 [Marasmius tenuissimus]|uniref:Uncharacterized protein n=1 Tax=Marasmius tenuissimus TaxID=585030 RepID=A0ABR2Z7U8_9AGAR